MNTTTLPGRKRFGLSAFLWNAILPLSAVGLLCLVALNARANQYQEQQSGQEQGQDPPTRVARISYLDGTVSMQPGGEGDWADAAKNRPVTIGDKLWVDKDSRAELQAGQVTIHIGSMTALSFLNLDANITQMRLAEGSVNFRVRDLQQGDLCELDSPNLAFIVRQAGEFRIDVDENGEATRVTVIRGEGEVAAGGKTYPIHAGEQAEFTGTDTIAYNIQAAPPPDGLDGWSAERDLKEDNSVSAKYVPRDMSGYSDLDDNGTWNQEPEYGNVWYPNSVDPGWAPYSTGYWNWVGPWGWTWVDYSPWGFAPFHYGRWAYIGNRWGWCPGSYYGRPVYGPAFVGFYGAGFSIGVGWFPLGYGEPFYPWYRCGRGYVQNVNIRNTYIRNTNVLYSNNRNYNYVNAHNVRAVTVANRNTFVSGHSINRGEFRVSQATLRGAQVTNSVGLHPTQHSYFGGGNSNLRVARPPASVQNRTVIARTAPAAGASQMRVRTVDSGSLTPGRIGNNNAPRNAFFNRPGNGARNQGSMAPVAPVHNAPATNGRPGAFPGNSSVSPHQRELSEDRPPSSVGNSQRMPSGTFGSNPSQRSGNSARTWEAQGNSTDRGHAPADFGNSNRRANYPVQSDRMPRGDRPPFAGNSNAPVNNPASRTPTINNNGNRSSYPNGGRSYEPPQRTYRDMPSNNNNHPVSQPRSYEPPQRTYRDMPNNNNRGASQPPPRSYNPPPSYSAPHTNPAPRTYSPPSRSYPAPSHSNSAPPSRSSDGNGGGNRGGGGGNPHGGGSVSHSRH